MDKKENRLLPCPFCGEELHEPERRNEWDVINCGNCGASGPYGEDGADILNDNLSGKAMWNTRTLPPEVKEALGKLRFIITKSYESIVTPEDLDAADKALKSCQKYMGEL